MEAKSIFWLFIEISSPINKQNSNQINIWVNLSIKIGNGIPNLIRGEEDLWRKHDHDPAFCLRRFVQI